MKIQKFLELNSAAAIVFSAQEIERRFRVEFKTEDLAFLDALILTALFFEKDHSTQPSALARTFQQSKSNTSHLLSKLQTKRLITRKASPDDLRKQVVALTASGEKLSLKLIKYFDRLQTRIESANGSEEKIRRLNEKIRSIKDCVPLRE